MKNKIKQIKIIFTLALLTTVVACGGGGDGDGGKNNPPAGDAKSNLEGEVQKGPFKPGGTVTAIQLKDNGEDATQKVEGSIKTNGTFNMVKIPWSGATSVSVEGIYFDEIKAVFSKNSMRLQAVILADKDLKFNVNLFTHIMAMRVRFLMQQKKLAKDALAQSQTELKALLGIEANPSQLNLLKAAVNKNEEDGTNLLLFSASFLKAGLAQKELDELAKDFADDGEINGSGVTHLQKIAQANRDNPQLLATIRTNLINQYSTKPPSHIGFGFAWLYGIIKEGDAYNGSVVKTELRFTPKVTGYFSVELHADNLSTTNSCSFKLAKLKATFQGSNYGGCRYYDAPELLQAGITYIFRIHFDESSKGTFSFFVNQNTIGSINEPFNIKAGVIHEGVVGTKGNTTNKSYYHFSVTSKHKIQLSKYVCGAGKSLQLELFGDENFKIFKGASRDGDACLQEIEIEPGSYWLKVQNLNNREYIGASGRGIDYELFLSKL